MEEKLTINSPSYILQYESRDLSVFHKVYLGSYLGNLLEVYQGKYHDFSNFTLVSLESATKGKPKYNYSDYIEEASIFSLPYNRGDSFVYDFNFYYDENSVNIVRAGNNSDKKVDMIYKEGRLECGLEDYDLIYIKINDLTPEEFSLLEEALKERNVEVTLLEENSIDDSVEHAKKK